MALNVVRSFDEIMNEAREFEASDVDKSIKLYERAIKMESHNEIPYNRLMILLRKQKLYEEELELINKGIKTFEEFYKKRSAKLIGKNKFAAKLSDALARSLGQRGKKVEDLYQPEPIPKWTKRKQLVEKKVRNK